MDVIQTNKLTKYYGKTKGILDLDLSVSRGEFFGFIGPNGAGKSTTIRTLLGMIRPTSGEARLLGMDIQKNKEQILARTGYLPSETVFYSGMKVADVLKLSANLRKVDCAEEAERLCRRLQLDTAPKVETLSFGNRKKLAIVCAMQHRPEILVLDEPTSGLDPLMQREFFSILREYNQAGTTVFLSSHILSEVQRNCTRAAIIREGRLIACESMETLAKTSAKRVTVHGAVQMDSIRDARDIIRTEDSVSFLYSGDINALLSTLARGQIKDITIAEPDLEEVFLHYYEKDGGQP